MQEVPTTIDALIRRRELLIQRIQRLNILQESYLRYVTTINETFQILKRSIEPYYYGDNAYIMDNREASNVQGTKNNAVFTLLSSLSVIIFSSKVSVSHHEIVFSSVSAYAAAKIGRSKPTWKIR